LVRAAYKPPPPEGFINPVTWTISPLGQSHRSFRGYRGSRHGLHPRQEVAQKKRNLKQEPSDNEGKESQTRRTL
jgi:hypothetical protein